MTPASILPSAGMRFNSPVTVVSTPASTMLKTVAAAASGYKPIITVQKSGSLSLSPQTHYVSGMVAGTTKKVTLVKTTLPTSSVSCQPCHLIIIDPNI